MSASVCLLARTLTMPEGGGHLWVYLNWALGLRRAGCRVVWLEVVKPDWPNERTAQLVELLRERLAVFGFDEALVVAGDDGSPLAPEAIPGCLPLEAAFDADLFLDMAYGHPPLVAKFRRSAFLDIDPGLCQIWIGQGDIALPPHDVYFTIGETVGKLGSRIPDIDIPWIYSPPCVDLASWPLTPGSPTAPFTTVSGWHMSDWVVDGEESYANDKRTGFQPFLDLPGDSKASLELALAINDDDPEYADLVERGWRVAKAAAVAGTPAAYQSYIQGSAGEFSACKPSCVRLQNAWISDRTLCYLASGRPAVVRHTGPSDFLPDDAGLLRFTDRDSALRLLDVAQSDYERQSGLARALAAEHFDAAKVVPRLLERAL